MSSFPRARAARPRSDHAALRCTVRQGAARQLRLSVLGATLLGVVGCSTQPDIRDAISPDGRVLLGVGALPGKPGYESVLQGLELAIARLNEASGATNADGTPLRFGLRTPDAGSVSAVQVAAQMRGDVGVIGVIGHPESGNTLEAMPIYADAEHAGADAVVAISPTASSPDLSGISPWFFRVAPSDNEAARFVARWVRDSLRARRAAIIYRNDSYGRAWSATFTDAFSTKFDSTDAAARDAAARVVEREPYLTGITEWDAYARLLARQRPDVLLFPGDAADAIALLRALAAINVRIPFVGGDGTEGMRDAPEAVGARFVAFFRPERATSAEGRRFLERYRAQYKTEPDMFAALSYDAALAIGRSVQAGARTRLAVRIALERLGHDSTPIEGVAGPIAFELNHDIAGRSVVVTTIGAGVTAQPTAGSAVVGAR